MVSFTGQKWPVFLCPKYFKIFRNSFGNVSGFIIFVETTDKMELVINFSGGKDSCAMLAFLCEKYPDLKKHVVFADTGWEHTDAEEWCRKIVESFGLELHVARNPNKTLLSMAKNRGKFPGINQRQCTSDLKRDPINTWIRRNVKSAVVINCTGIRSEESSNRAGQKRLKRNNRITNSKRTVWDWMPIKDWKETEVRSYLEAKGIPLHPVYNYLNRFSCRVCIFMNSHMVKKVFENDPQAIYTVAKLEREIGFYMTTDGYLDEILNLDITTKTAA